VIAEVNTALAIEKRKITAGHCPIVRQSFDILRSQSCRAAAPSLDAIGNPTFSYLVTDNLGSHIRPARVERIVKKVPGLVVYSLPELIPSVSFPHSTANSHQFAFRTRRAQVRCGHVADWFSSSTTLLSSSTRVFAVAVCRRFRSFRRRARVDPLLPL
jgi:hypothetical protein